MNLDASRLNANWPKILEAARLQAARQKVQKDAGASPAPREYLRHPKGVKVDPVSRVGGGRFASPGQVASPSSEPVMDRAPREWTPHGVYTEGPRTGQPLPNPDPEHGNGTLGFYDSEATPEERAERERVREKILQDILEGHVSKEQPELIMMVGGTASGKGTIVGAIKAFHEASGDSIAHIDSDEIKKQLPEYGQALNQPGGWAFPDRVSAKDAAWIVHEESSMLAGEATERALNAKIDMIYDGTGKNAKKYMQTIEKAKALGYKVTLIVAHSDYETALPRMIERAESTGRWVEPKEMAKMYPLIAPAFNQYAEMADQIQVWDNRGKNPTLAWYRGHGLNEIHDAGLAFTYGRDLIRGGRILQRSRTRILNLPDRVRKAGRDPESNADWLVRAIRRYFPDVRELDRQQPRRFPKPTDWLPWPADDSEEAFLRGLNKGKKKP